MADPRTLLVIGPFAVLLGAMSILWPGAFQDYCQDRKYRRRLRICTVLLLVSASGAVTAAFYLHHAMLNYFVGATLGSVAWELGEARRKGIARPPLSALHSIADLFYSPKIRERIFDQIVLDNREEYFEAMASGRRLKTFVVRVRGICAFGSAILAHGLGGVLRLAYNIFKAAH